MALLISHWHCIIPAVAILFAMVFLRDKDSGKDKKGENQNTHEEYLVKEQKYVDLETNQSRCQALLGTDGKIE